MYRENRTIPSNPIMDSTKRLPPPENPPNNRSSTRPPFPPRPPPAAPHPSSIREILALPPLPPQPPSRPPVEYRWERVEVPMSPEAVENKSTREETAVEVGGREGVAVRPAIRWSEREEVPLSPVLAANRSVRAETGAVMKVDRERPRVVSSILWRPRSEEEAALGFRVLAMVFCLVSFSVMAADRTQGWAGDSFERYKEYRYCISVTVIGFVYSGFQVYGLTRYLITRKHVINHPIRYYFDFSMDQTLSYLLMSSSSSAATRTDNWVLNWGEDEFTKMATASVGMSFLAFIAFAFSSLISGYNLCT